MRTFLFSVFLTLSAAHAAPRTTTVMQIIQGECDGETVQVSGMIVESFPDETDEDFQRLLLFDGGDLLDVACPRDRFPPSLMSRLVDAHVRITGLVTTKNPGFRKHRPPFLCAVDEIKVLKVAPPGGDFDAPPLKPVNELGSLEIKRLGRRTVVGKVLAAWQGSSLLVHAPDCGKIRVQLARSVNTPLVGDDIAVVGIAATDSVDFILKCARWRPAAAPTACPDVGPKDITPEDLDGPWAHSNFSRETVRVRGRVVHPAWRNSADATLLLECGRHTIRIDPGNQPNVLRGIETGSQIEVSGVGFCRIDPDTLDLPFTKFREFLLVVRTPEDVRILAQPPWWTPRRLTVVLAALLLVLSAILVWNRLLQRLVERKSRELADERLVQLGAQLRVEERTSLAVELHDSLSQVLTGAAMEIETAQKLRGAAPADMLTHLDTAGKTLQSCRDELRNCLWDLRSQALDVPDMTTAILKTLQPHIADSRLNVRFNVPRRQFSDNTAHAILRVIRELVLNALRHGQATVIRVAGSLDADGVRFSVTDDGTGFDPDAAPGISQGHFGLQGIRERIRKFGGTFSLASTLGHGTKATVLIPILRASPT